MPSSVGATHRSHEVRRPRRPQPGQHPHDRGSRRDDRLGRVARRRPDLDLALPHNAAGLDDDAYGIAAQARAAWEAAVCWDPSGTDQFAVKRLAEVRAV
jgi:hypothetical protein